MKIPRSAVSFVRVYRRWAFQIRSVGASTVAGEQFVVGPRVRVARGFSVHIGDHVSISSDVTVQANLSVGDDVMISSNVAFIGKDHDFSESDFGLHQQAILPPARIVLEGDNLIGYGTIILGDVTVGRGAIIGAGSLVTRDIPGDTVCFGRPAKPIRARRASE